MTFQQADAAANASAVAAHCSGAPLNSTTYSRTAANGGAAGSSPLSVTVQASAAGQAALWFEIAVPAGATWGAGTWTLPLHITTSNAFVTCDDIYLCRVNSSYVSQATIGNAGSGFALTPTGVQTSTISGASQTPGVGDKVIAIYLFSNGQLGGQSFQFTPDQLITAAGFAAGGGGSTISEFSMRSDIPNPFVGPMVLRQAWRPQPIQDQRLAAITDTNFGPLNRGFPNPRIGPVVLRQRWRGVRPSVVTPPPAVGANGDALWRMRFVRPPVHSINRNLPEDFVYG